MALNSGDTLNNKQYHIIREIGQGGFGSIYLAQDTVRGKQVAIKEMIPALVVDEAMRARFLAEAGATMDLTNKHIVRTHFIFQEERGNYYIPMEYLAGGSLEDRLRANGALPVDDAVRVASEVCEGLACAHEEQVIHCDLKPANILFDSRGNAKVADFGIAHIRADMLPRFYSTPTGLFVGTPFYMSPEQTEGVRDDPRIDIYALGAVLYRMLTGRTYLDFKPEQTEAARAYNITLIRDKHPEAPSVYNARVPEWLDGVVLTALAKCVEERYASAEVMRAALLQPQSPSIPLVPASAPVLVERPPDQSVAGATPVTPPKVSPTMGENTSPATETPFALPVLFWPLAGVAGVLLVFLIIAMVALAKGVTLSPLPWAESTNTAAPTEVTAAKQRSTIAPAPTILPTDTDEPTSLPTPTFDLPNTMGTPPPAGATHTRIKDGMVMVYVPTGGFLMGTTDTEIDAILAECPDCKQDRFTPEQPQHVVTLDGFWIDKTEVTNAQYHDCVAAGACTASHYAYDRQYNASQKPVVGVSWHDAYAYCRWAAARLPTEAEWEKAARGIDARIYPWGNTLDDHKANLCDRTCELSWKDRGLDDDQARTAPVGSYPAGGSLYGALDLAGNVWEWVADWYDDDYYTGSPADNPTGPDSGDQKVQRGGSWYVRSYGVRAPFRNYGDPADRTDYTVGFRCAAGSPRH